MKVEEAKRILEKPKFGDPLCIAAAQRLREAEEETKLRKLLVGKMLDCIVCGYRGDKKCHMCKGAGKHVISKKLADSWTLDILQQVQEEIGA